MHHDIQSWVTAIQQIVCKSDEVLRFLREMVRQMISWEIMVSHTPVTRKCEQLALCLKRNRIYSPSPPPPPLPPHTPTRTHCTYYAYHQIRQVPNCVPLVEARHKDTTTSCTGFIGLAEANVVQGRTPRVPNARVLAGVEGWHDNAHLVISGIPYTWMKTPQNENETVG